MAVIIGHASIDERGKANSGQAGLQTFLVKLSLL